MGVVKVSCFKEILNTRNGINVYLKFLKRRVTAVKIHYLLNFVTF